ncbi:MAG: hypothetical protein GQ538_08250, partial [Xanthomonadales bacterium]|nr:hypothetical protein [Xanthomonadales bacterium]
MKITKHQGFNLGEWRVYPDQGLLVGPTGQSHIEPKVMEVLVYLAERQDEVVRRDELINDVWHGTFASDEVLSRAISLLRTHLGDNRMTPIFIQTLPKVGYRLLMEVTPLAEPETSDEQEVNSEIKPRAQNFQPGKWAFPAGFAITVIV